MGILGVINNLSETIRISVATELRSFLLADADISDLVGTRIHPLTLPQNPTLPAITFQWISGTRSHHYQGPDGLSRPRIQFDCYASTYLEMEELSEALRARMDGFSGIIGDLETLSVQGIFFDSERDFYEDGADQGTGSGAGLYRRSVDYFVNYTEEA